MMNKSALRCMVTMITTVGIALSLGACRIEKIEPKKEKAKGELDIFFADDKFNPDKVVADMWDKDLLPFADKNALDLKLVLDALNADRDQAGAEYGHREKAGGSPWNYIVKAQAKIVEVNTKSRASTVGIDIEPFDGEKDALVQIGPVIKGTSVRDALDFLKFDNFTNQLEFARVSNSLNKKVNAAVLSSLDREALADKELTFTGMFTDNGANKPVLITPVRLSVNNGG